MWQLLLCNQTWFVATEYLWVQLPIRLIWSSGDNSFTLLFQMMAVLNFVTSFKLQISFFFFFIIMAKYITIKSSILEHVVCQIDTSWVSRSSWLVLLIPVALMLVCSVAERDHFLIDTNLTWEQARRNCQVDRLLPQKVNISKYDCEPSTLSVCLSVRAVSKIWWRWDPTTLLTSLTECPTPPGSAFKRRTTPGPAGPMGIHSPFRTGAPTLTSRSHGTLPVWRWSPRESGWRGTARNLCLSFATKVIRKEQYLLPQKERKWKAEKTKWP